MLAVVQDIRERAAYDMQPGPWVPGARRYDEAFVVYCWATELGYRRVRDRLG